MSEELSAERIREVNDIDDEAKTGKITHDEARQILSRFINSHFNNAGEKARASIPVDFTRDDDIRMVAYIVQMRRRDTAIADALDERDKLRKALEQIANAYPDRQPGSEHGCCVIARTALAAKTGGAE